MISGENSVLRQKLAQLSEKSKKNITEQSWKQASPMKKSTGPGDFYGSLQGRIAHVSVSISKCLPGVRNPATSPHALRVVKVS